MDKRVSPVYRNKLEFVSENIPSSGKLLDSGCGAGLYFHLYRDNSLEFVGLEPDPGLISDNMVCAAAEEMPFDEGVFDSVVCADVMEHVDDPNKAIGEINRVLKKGGKLVLTVPNKKFPFVYDPINWGLNRFGMKLPIGLWAWGHRRLYTEEGIKNLIENNGFKIQKYEGRSRYFVALFVNYLPYLATYVFSPVMKKFGMKKQSKFKTHEGVENSKVYKFYNKINEFDKRKFKKGAFINHCLVAEKI